MWKHGLVGAVLVGSAWGQVTQRVSVSTRGVQGNGDTGFGLAMSTEGRYVAFRSQASNLVQGDTNHRDDIFVRDLRNGTTECVSVNSTGGQGGKDSYFPAISADGRYVAFHSNSANLVPGDTNGASDIFVHDRMSRATERVSVSSGGAQGNDSSSWAAISADGRFVAFHSAATNLVPGDTNGALDVFVHDRRNGTTERVSVSSNGEQGDMDSYTPSISADGRYVAFVSDALNLVPGGTNGLSQAFVHDRLTGTTELASLNSNGQQAQCSCLYEEIYCRISGDGRYVVFDNLADNLVAGDTNGVSDVFVRDLRNGTTERVSVASSGAQGDAESSAWSISDDGRYVVFSSLARDLAPPDTNRRWDVFVRDRQLGTTERVSLSSSGGQGDDGSSGGYISDDGRLVTFQSYATNLVPGDTNQHVDVFVRDRFGGPTFTSLCDPNASGVIACPCSNPPGGPDQGCDNSSATGGATLSASGGTYISSDSLEFHVTGTTPSALSMLLQGTAAISTGAVYGQGVRCVGGTLVRLGTKHASGGSITIPEFEVGDSQVTVASAAKGDLIPPGDSRYYLVFYRDPVVLGGCPASSTFNCTQTGMVTWSP